MSKKRDAKRQNLWLQGISFIIVLIRMKIGF